MVSALLVIGLWLAVHWTGRPRRLLMGGILIGIWCSYAFSTLVIAAVEFWFSISE